MKMTQAKKKAFWQSLPATPYILWMALFIIIPLGMVVFFALTDPQGNFTLENIARGGEHMGVLLRSIKLAAIATALCVLIAYPLAYILSRKKGFQKQTLFIMVMLPMWMNSRAVCMPRIASPPQSAACARRCRVVLPFTLCIKENRLCDRLLFWAVPFERICYVT